MAVSTGKGVSFILLRILDDGSEVLNAAATLNFTGGTLTVSGDQVNIPLGNSGTVTSVGILSTDLSVSGSPVTTSGNITININNGVVTLAKMADLATDRLIGRDTVGTGVPEALTVGGGIEFTGSGGIQRSAFSGGDVTGSAGSATLTIANESVTYAKMQNVSAASRLLGRGSAAGAGDVEELTAGNNMSFSGTTFGLDRVITVSGSAPSGGNDGDLWFQV